MYHKGCRDERLYQTIWTNSDHGAISVFDQMCLTYSEAYPVEILVHNQVSGNILRICSTFFKVWLVDCGAGAKKKEVLVVQNIDQTKEKKKKWKAN